MLNEKWADHRKRFVNTKIDSSRLGRRRARSRGQRKRWVQK